MPPPRSRPTATTKRGSPADRAEEFHAEQVRLKQEAADRRAQREAAGEESGRRRRGQRST